MKSDFCFRRNPSQQNGTSYLLLFFSLLLLFVAGAFFQEHIVVFNKNPSTFMNNSEFFVSFAMVVSALASFFFLVNRNFKIRIHWGWAILFLVLFGCNAVGLFSMESVVDLGEFGAYEFTFIQRIHFLLLFGVACTFFYIFFAVAPRLFHNVRYLNVVVIGLLLVNLAALIYSFAAEGNLWITAFLPKAEWRVDEVCSFTNNPNQFALFPLVAIMGVMLMHNRHSHWWWYVVLFALGIEELFISSGSGIFSSWAMIFIFVFYRFGVTLKYHTGAACLGLFIFFVAIGIIMIFMFTGCGGPDFILTRMGIMLQHVSSHFKDGTGRFDIWNAAIWSLDTPLKLAFGVGDTQALFYLNLILFPDKAGALYYTHNGFVQQVLNGGLIRLAINLIIIIRHVYICFMNLKDKSRVATISLIACVGFLIRSIIETNGFLFADGNTFVVYLFIMLPVEIVNFKNKHPVVATYERAIKDEGKKVRCSYDYSPLRMAKVTLMILAPIAAILLGSFPQFFRAGVFVTLERWEFYFLVCEVLLLAPFAMYCIGYHPDRFDRKIFGFLSLFTMLVAAMVGLILLGGNVMVTYVCMGIVGFIPLLCFLCHIKPFFEFREKLFLHAYLPHLIVVGSFAGLSTLAYLSPVEEFSAFIPFMIAVSIFSFYITFYYSKPGEDLVMPLALKLRHFEARRAAKSVIAEEKMVADQDDYLVAGHGYVRPKKTYIEWI